MINRINQVFKNEDLKTFFTKDCVVKTETEILLPNGETYIPDRVIIKDNTINVIDYKTGSILKIESHKEQLYNYASILKMMGYVNIKLFLVYIDEDIQIVKL